MALDLLTHGWTGLLAGHFRGLLESAISAWLPRQRWFGAKTRKIQSTRVLDWAELPAAIAANRSILSGAGHTADTTIPPALLFVEIAYTDGSSDTYQLPLAFSTCADAEDLIASYPQSILATFRAPAGPGVLHDATTREDFRQDLLSLIERNATLALSTTGTAAQEIAASLATSATNESLATGSATMHHRLQEVFPTSDAALANTASVAQTQSAFNATSPQPAAGDAVLPKGHLDAHASTAFCEGHISQRLPSRVCSAEQSNTSIIYGKQLIVKLFRRLQAGENPDVEIGRFLTEVAHFPHIARLLGEISMTPAGGEKTTVAMLQGLVANQGDGWQWFLEQLAGFFRSTAALPAPPKSLAPSFLNECEPLRDPVERVGPSLEAAAILGRPSPKCTSP